MLHQFYRFRRNHFHNAPLQDVFLWNFCTFDAKFTIALILGLWNDECSINTPCFINSIDLAVITSIMCPYKTIFCWNFGDFGTFDAQLTIAFILGLWNDTCSIIRLCCINSINFAEITSTMRPYKTFSWNFGNYGTFDAQLTIAFILGLGSDNWSISRPCCINSLDLTEITSIMCPC